MSLPLDTIHCGDALEFLPTLPDGCAHAVVTDPPYSINTKSARPGKINPWADACNAALWYATWMRECRRLLRADGCLWSFLSWRTLTTFQKAAWDVGWEIESLLVWDKGWIGPGGMRGLRPSYELVALWIMPEFAIDDRGTPDIIRVPWAGHKPSGHPAEKPIDLVVWILNKSGIPEGGVVIDPFTGSGTTPAACAATRRHFVGCEIYEAYADMARRRVNTANGGPLFAEAEPVGATA